MKKITFIFLIVLGLFVVSITQASAGCNIVWTGDLRGSVPTNETSKTQQAAYKAYMSILPANIICKAEQPDWSGSCYSVDIEGFGFECSNDVCISGTWSFYWYVAGGASTCGAHPERCYGSGGGNWDVICDTTTTTIQQTTTTTTAPATLINLASFTATPKFSKVIIQWSTESEIDNAGFNLYRSETEDGNYTKINSSLIPAQGSSTQGANYELIDKDVKNRKTYYYKLEDIDLSGASTMHGPVSATPLLIFGLRN